MAATHVNLVDLVDGGRVERFPNVAALRKYTMVTTKYFPRENAHASGLLKHLLRQIHNPPAPKGGKGARGTS